eukprot:Skav217666  [mRNA]  locus=scaffold2919:176612:178294:+ [translate_table: standard]
MLTRDQRRTSTGSAYSLHESVAADRWCVTFSDVNFLRRELQRAIRNGEILEPADGQDNFHSWPEYGPNIYTVNEQYIKPVTRLAGKMSWALMRNREGLDCDLFISHAWQEGVFEFLAKVRNSWPRGLRHAWCCMLANPQNLNIASFLVSPRTSPFAIALKAAKVVLVVPNRHKSVYSRLWCSYEAYLAQEEGKPILIAKASHFRKLLQLLLRMAAAAILGTFIGGILSLLQFSHRTGVPAFVGIVCCLSLSIENNRLRLILNLLGQVLVWVQMISGNEYFHTDLLDGVNQGVVQGTRKCYWMSGSIVFCIMDYDRVRGLSTMFEAEELDRGYKGIEHAECSEASDAVNIRREIGNQVEAVDHAIGVLLAAGMSTPKLQEIARKGVDIKSAAFTEFTGTFLLLGPFGTMAAITTTLLYVRYGGGSWYLIIPPSLSIAGRLVLIIKFICLTERDEQCFILKVMGKFMASMLAMFAISVILCFHLSYVLVAIGWLLVSDLHLFVMLCLVFLGIRGTAKLPFGLHLLQMFFTRGHNACFGPETCSPLSPTPSGFTDSESSTDSE